MDLFIHNFLKIILENEFHKKDKKCKKWVDNIIIYTFFEKYSIELDKELNNIIKDINNLSQTIKLSRTDDLNEANLRVYLSSRKTFQKIIPENYQDLLNRNYGLGIIFYNRKYIIHKADIYVDTERTVDINCQKHLLREEITQILGMVNDIQISGSIFNQKWECTTKYNKFDKLIIYFFLSKQIKPGMDEKDIIDIYNSSNL